MSERKARGAAGAWTAAVIVMGISLLSTFTLATPRRARTIVALDPNGSATRPVDSATGPLPATSGIAVPSANPTTPVTVAGKTYDCSRGQNAGATDVGVTASQIRFAATTVESGIAKDFLRDAKFGMLAVIQKVNRSGGVCGRQIKVDFRDDAWDPQTGQRFIESFIADRRYFGLAVNPSSEGLRGAIDSGTIRRAGFPVIGADGMLLDQYTDPWVWPVATSTASVMHIMAADAFERGARNFGIVWESNYRFGKEGHAAFVGAVKRLGGKVTSDAELTGGQNDYSNQANAFIGDCGGVSSLANCDFIAMLLEPATATQWVKNGGLGNGEVRPKVGIGAPQPLFIDSFARNCAKFCAGMRAWTSFKPPLPPFDADPAVRTYLADLRAVSASADANNPHVEGAYVGMQMLVEALARLGPAPTRPGVKRVLDAMAFASGLGPTLRFRAGNHFASVAAQAYQAITQDDERGTFANWRYTNTGFISDREVGKDVS